MIMLITDVLFSFREACAVRSVCGVLPGMSPKPRGVGPSSPGLESSRQLVASSRNFYLWHTFLGRRTRHVLVRSVGFIRSPIDGAHPNSLHKLTQIPSLLVFLAFPPRTIWTLRLTVQRISTNLRSGKTFWWHLPITTDPQNYLRGPLTIINSLAAIPETQSQCCHVLNGMDGISQFRKARWSSSRTTLTLLFLDWCVNPADRLTRVLLL